MLIQKDGKDQIYVEWPQGPNGAKRAWILLRGRAHGG
jgi:hypothetical protein